MSETQTDKAEVKPASGQEQAVYTYESAGVAEREGNVPLWLWSVVILLLIWGIYYLFTYWNAPAVLS